jgi:hypothetical protein
MGETIAVDSRLLLLEIVEAEVTVEAENKKRRNKRSDDDKREDSVRFHASSLLECIV